MTADASTIRSLVLYGAHLFPAKLASLLDGAHPISSSTARIRDAWLTFDLPGVPFLEPVYANALVKGVNDEGEWYSGFGEKNEQQDERETEAYKRFVWERSCPGVPFEGALPPNLEGIVYELSQADYNLVLSRAQASFPSSPLNPAALVPVRCIKFKDGDDSKPSGEVTADLLVAMPKSRPAGLQPTQQYLGLVVRGAFLSALSLPYLNYLTLLRPYVPSTPEKRLTRSLFRLLLVPSFLIFHLPSKALGPWWAKLGAILTGGGTGKLRLLERLVRGWSGSGFRNEDDHAAAQATKK
ncbi:hypothetical protein JCM8547_004797 [Rhodosporidiobolus lusitaniae]